MITRFGHNQLNSLSFALFRLDNLHKNYTSHCTAWRFGFIVSDFFFLLFVVRRNIFQQYDNIPFTTFFALVRWFIFIQKLTAEEQTWLSLWANELWKIFYFNKTFCCCQPFPKSIEKLSLLIMTRSWFQLFYHPRKLFHTTAGYCDSAEAIILLDATSLIYLLRCRCLPGNFLYKHCTVVAQYFSFLIVFYLKNAGIVARIFFLHFSFLIYFWSRLNFRYPRKNQKFLFHPQKHKEPIISEQLSCLVEEKGFRFNWNIQIE